MAGRGTYALLLLVVPLRLSGDFAGAQQPAAGPPPVASPAPQPTKDQQKAAELYKEWFSKPASEEKVNKLEEAARLDFQNQQYYMAWKDAQQALKDKNQKDAEEQEKQKQQRDENAHRNEQRTEAERQRLEGREAMAGGDAAQARKSLEGALQSAQAAKDPALVDIIRGDIAALDNEAAKNRQLTNLLLTALGAAVAGTIALIVWWRKRKRTLVMVEGPERGKVFKLEKELTTIGAVQADWVVDDPYRKLSRLHCQIARSGRHFFVVDCSRNGTFLNGRAIPKGEPILLRANDEITLCDDVILIFR